MIPTSSAVRILLVLERLPCLVPYLHPYSPDLNPIEKLFVEPKLLSRAIGSSMSLSQTKALILSSNGALILWVGESKVQQGIVTLRSDHRIYESLSSELWLGRLYSSIVFQ